VAIIDAQNEIVASELDLDAVLGLAAARACALTGADAAAIELVEGDQMVCAAAAGTAEPHRGLRMGREGTVSGICVELNEVVRGDYPGSADRRVDPEPWVDDGVGSVLCVPLTSGAAAVGTLKAYAAAPRDFDAADEQTLELLAGLVVAHLSQANRLDGDWSDERHDPVTELPNRHSYEQRLALEAERARRYRYPLALVMIEIDGLTGVYEELGEGAGDAAVREVAQLLNGSRFADEAFRISATQFAILLPHTDLAGAEAAAARLTMQISAGGVIGASWGAASGEDHPASLEDRARKSLLAAKDSSGIARSG
jgi:diguanylate cyclase (GGDEF)-like protein